MLNQVLGRGRLSDVLQARKASWARRLWLRTATRLFVRQLEGEIPLQLGLESESRLALGLLEADRVAWVLWVKDGVLQAQGVQ